MHRAMGLMQVLNMVQCYVQPIPHISHFGCIFTPFSFDPNPNPQHHDAVTGTEKQNVADDYRLSPFLFFTDNEKLPQLKKNYHSDAEC